MTKKFAHNGCRKDLLIFINLISLSGAVIQKLCEKGVSLHFSKYMQKYLKMHRNGFEAGKCAIQIKYLSCRSFGLKIINVEKKKCDKIPTM